MTSALPAAPALALLLIASSPEITSEERQRHLASFDFLWATGRDRHYDPALGGLDRNAVRQELRPKVEAAASVEEVRRTLRDLIGWLKLEREARLKAVVKLRQWTYPGFVAALEWIRAGGKSQ